MRCLALLAAATAAVLLPGASIAQRSDAFQAEDPANPRRSAFGAAFDLTAGASGLQEVDGALLGLGDGYKSFFDADGMLFIPALGDRVANTQTLRLTLESIRRGSESVYSNELPPEPRIRGGEVVYQHGGIAERYEVRSEAVEQSFVFPTQPGRSGDLVVRLRVETSLHAALGTGLQRLGLQTDDGLPAVEIGRVLGIDAAGRQVGGHMDFLGTHLELVLPDAFVSSAAYPLVLDPPIYGNQTIAGPSTVTLRKPDIAYMAADDRYLAVYEVAFSASDYDIQGVLLGPTGLRVSSLFGVDATSADTREPAVASVAGRRRFAVVYQRGPLGARDILVRSVDARSAAVGSAAVVAATGGDEFEPDVGGEVSTAANDALLVWADASSGVKWAEVEIRSDGSMGVLRTLQMSNTRTARRPAITQSGGAARIHLVAWNEGNNNFVGAKFVTADSVPLGPECFFPNSNRSPLSLKVDGDGRTFHLTYSLQEVAGSNASFDTVHMNVIPPQSGGCFAIANYTVIDGRPGISTSEPTLATINGRSVVAVTERVGSGSGASYRVIASTRAANGSLVDQWFEIGDPIASAPLNIHQSVASRQSGGSPRHDALFVWATLDSTGRSRIRGRVYLENSVRGSISQTSPGCGGLALTHTGGQPILGSAVDFQLGTLRGVGLIWIGIRPSNVPICSACILGAEPLDSFNGGSITGLAIPQDTNLVGGNLYLQGADLFVTGGCPSPFNLTLSNTLRMTIGGW